MKSLQLLIVILLVCLLLPGCNQSEEANEQEGIFSPTLNSTAALTPVPIPSSTLPPLAALVNGEGILLEDYETELIRLQSAQEEINYQLTPEEQSQMVLDQMIEQLLLAQSAIANGFTFNEIALQEAMDDLAEKAGGQEALLSWMTDNGYNEDSMRRAVRLSYLAAWQRDYIAATTPKTAEQVHARQILVQSRQEAESILSQIQHDISFDALIEQYDPLTGGELGWFPRGYLYVQEVEDAAFHLEPGEISAIIESDIGYHIIQVLERDSQHPLSEDAWQILAQQAVRDWLLEQRQSADIQILIR